MGLFEGFPFVSKEERERRQKDFEKRVAPFGVEAQRDKLKETLAELFPDVDYIDATFAFFDAKDAYTKKDDAEAGLAAARVRFRRQRWIDEDRAEILLRLIELDIQATSLDDYPTAEDVMKDL